MTTLYESGIRFGAIGSDGYASVVGDGRTFALNEKGAEALRLPVGSILLVSDFDLRHLPLSKTKGLVWMEEVTENGGLTVDIRKDYFLSEVFISD